MADGLFLILLTFIAASIGTMTGFGTSTIMVPTLSLFLPLPQTLLFVGIIHWFGDIWKIIFFKKGFNLKLILMFGIPGTIFSFLAAKLPLTLPQVLLSRSLGLFLAAYVAFLFLKPNWKLKASTPTALLGGTLSGFFSGIFGVGGAIRSSFLTAFNLEKSVFLFTSGVIGLFIDSSRLVQYSISGIRLGPLMTALVLCIPASFLGARVAKTIVTRIPQPSFRLVIALFLFLVGLRYLIV
ncbi:MAG: sulfite exporter TauE/SafE family protein [Candidatus Chisholmbacteria bacterium]|nr:sulfite exporter TauE/SafE family protein [Candidatus Chisholmbacteria bacterium]